MKALSGWFDSVTRWWRSDASPVQAVAPADQASDALRQLLHDPSVPESVRRELGDEFARIEALLDKLARGELHLAVFGRVSVGKSALGNALLGEPAFETGVLHGTTTRATQQPWTEAGGSGLHLIDTPGINELDGEARERLAFEVAEISDLVLFVVDGDMTQVERDALATLARTERPLLLVLNKADRYEDAERERLLARLREHAAGLLPADNVLACAAQPAPLRVIDVDAAGNERERRETRAPDVTQLRERLLAICAREGKTLSALNAGLFAGRLSDQVAQRVAEARRDVADKIIRYYCLAKGVAVALNPVPVADLLAAAALDAALVMHLGKVYGMPLTRREAGQLILTICAQLAALMGAIWGVHLVASALKVASAGVSTLLTAGAQGALAWYATQVVGRAAERYLVAGKSWGESGPKRAVQDIVAQLDRDSILREAREEILARLRSRPAR
ncbi:MAG: GTP-binding protein HSR1 [Lysobacterales bacterium 69-70]|nr:GTP-binding protein [Xanthomonadaceae bacterium]ODU35230.1 MAG: GTP-binding protein HSR1 [Xanthomonadaceae bacterium SCN 69-320]ODV15767.1 MAG: GTP-binding protein HSR1 [Xanthomonadaceae bacterium SCN 69-25]OJY94130.1 MAG: GTP-binding protein HSR1 [Xanthomonadales bacterium 69-70]